MSFCFESGRAIVNGRTDAEDEAPTQAIWYEDPTHWKRPWFWERIWAEGEGIKGWECEIASPTQRTWAWGNCKIVKDWEACFDAKYVITKSQTWLGNWTIPMRTQGPMKALVLVGVEKDLGGRGGCPSSGTSPWIQGNEHNILNALLNIVFLKNNNNNNNNNYFLQKRESFDWVCSLDFPEGCRRLLEWAESEKTRWPAARVWCLW